MTEKLNRAVAPDVHMISLKDMPAVQLTTLPSGAKLYTYTGGESDVTRIQIGIAGGLLNCPSPEIGALLPQLWIEGTHTMDADRIADFFDYRGAWIRCDMGVHTLDLTVNALNSNVDETIPVIADILTAPTFPADRLAHVKSLTESAIRVEQAGTPFRASQNLRKLIYGYKHPLAKSPVPLTLSKVSRESLSDYYSSLLNPGNISVFISGRLNDSTIEKVSQMLESIPSTGRKISVEVPAFDPNTAHGIVSSQGGNAQASVRMGLILPGRVNPDFIALRLLIFALGGYFGSRLMKNIREKKGYTYGINAVNMAYRNQAYMLISAECDKTYYRRLYNATIKQIELMKDASSYTADEIDRIRRLYLSNLAAMLDSPLSIMDYHRTAILNGSAPHYFEQQREAITNLTPELLATTAQKYFDTDRLYYSVAQ